LQDIRRLTDDLEARIGAEAVTAMGETAASRISAVVLGVRPFLNVVDDEDSAEGREIFLIVCLWCLGDGLETLPARFEG